MDDFRSGTVKLEARKSPFFPISCHDNEKYYVSSVISVKVSTCKMYGKKMQYLLFFRFSITQLTKCKGLGFIFFLYIQSMSYQQFLKSHPVNTYMSTLSIILGLALSFL